ncbi:hypothetical protein [Dolosicoccus paucivorans]|nr:hypothetical protein [Dolosicoccus paucivorans]
MAENGKLVGEKGHESMLNQSLMQWLMKGLLKIKNNYRDKEF